MADRVASVRVSTAYIRHASERYRGRFLRSPGLSVVVKSNEFALRLRLFLATCTDQRLSSDRAPLIQQIPAHK